MNPLATTILRAALAKGLAWTEEPAIEELRKVAGRSFLGRSAEGWNVRVVTFDATIAVPEAPNGTRGADGSAVGPSGALLHLPSDLAAIAGAQAEASIDATKEPAKPAKLAPKAKKRA